jgi:hypothetical protein
MNTALGPARYCLLPLPASHARERMRWLFAKIPERLGFPGVIEVTDGEGEVWYAT